MQSSIQLWLRPFRPCNTDKQIKGGLSSFHLVAPTFLIFRFCKPFSGHLSADVSQRDNDSVTLLSVCLSAFFSSSLCISYCDSQICLSRFGLRSRHWGRQGL